MHARPTTKRSGGRPAVPESFADTFALLGLQLKLNYSINMNWASFAFNALQLLLALYQSHAAAGDNHAAITSAVQTTLLPALASAGKPAA